MKTYKTTIGLEIHAELKTKSKMFCGCTNNPHGGEPNEFTCPVCLAHPGTLPTINKTAVQHILTVGTAVGGSLSTHSGFDRKNYFYPDIPKSYQISQHVAPFVRGGELSGVAIHQIHLEEDTARSQHDQGDGSLVDYNRASVPLMELVTEPVMHSAEEAGNFARELQLLLRTLEVSDANMERGEMRVEVNISVSDSTELGTKVEVKNINSFKAAEAAIVFEEKRQIAELEAGNKIIQETRGWDENKGKTFSQRAKETAHDYRYFPDPDLPALDLSSESDFDKSRIEDLIPVLPEEKRLKYNDIGLPSNQIEVLISNFELDKFFKETALNTEMEAAQVKIAANYITSDLVGYLQENPDRALCDASVADFSALVEMITKQEITSRVAKDIMPEVVFEGKNPKELAESKGLLQDNSEDSLAPVIEKIIAENSDVVAEYRAGKESAIQFFVGQGMKATKGAANPAILKKLLEEALRE